MRNRKEIVGQVLGGGRHCVEHDRVNQHDLRGAFILCDYVQFKAV